MRKPRWLYLCGLLLSIALVAAACGGDDDEDGDGGNGFQAGELGAVTVGPGEPIKIAVLQSITGDTASLGEDQVRAVELAIADQGDLLGHEIETQVEDDLCDSSGGTEAAQKIISDTQIVGIIGSSCSGAAVPASEIMSEEGLVMISGSNTSPFLTSVGGEEAADHHDGYFRTAHNDEIQGAAAATFAFDELGVEKAASIHDGDPYTEGLAGAFNTAFEDLGGEITVATAVTKGDTDMRPVLTEIAASEAELVFFPIFQPEGDFIAKQAQDVDGMEDVTLMGADGLLSDTYVSISETEDMYFSGPGTPSGGEYSDFVDKYEEEFGEKPIQAFHAHAYDAANLLFAAIEEVAVQEDDGTLNIDRQELRDAVGSITHDGLTGTIKCNEFGDCADPMIQIFQNTKDRETIADVRENPIFTFDEEASS